MSERANASVIPFKVDDGPEEGELDQASVQNPAQNPAERLHMAEAVRMAEAIVFASAEPVSEKQLAATGGEIISIRSDLMESGADAYLKTSLDPYAAAKSAYLQRRHAVVRDQEDGADAEPDAAVPEEVAPVSAADAPGETTQAQ